MLASVKMSIYYDRIAMVIKSYAKSYFDDAGAIAPAEILSFWANFVYRT